MKENSELIETSHQMDPQLQDLLNQEEEKQLSTINLIASENYASKTVRSPLSSCLSNKYAEGEPGDRLYPGVEVCDKIELLAIKNLKQLFKLTDDWIVNVQPLSGAPANLEMLTALFEPGATIMMLTHNHGGHMSHGDEGSLINKLYKVVEYHLNPETELLDFDEIESLIKQCHPQLIFAGFSLYPRDIDYEKFHKICLENNVHLHVDMAHIAGLIAAGQMRSPFEWADSVTTTTHKTLNGPRGGIIFSKKSCFKGVFPGVQAGPHMATIAAVAQMAFEAQQQKFVEYAKQTIKNAKTAANWFQENGYKVQTGGTDSHMVVIKIDKDAQSLLGKFGIYVNNCHMADGSNGMRLGFQCMATFGIDENGSVEICNLIHKALDGVDITQQVKQIAKTFKTM